MLKCLAKKNEPGLMLSSCLNFRQNEPHHAYNHHAYKKKCNRYHFWHILEKKILKRIFGKVSKIRNEVKSLLIRINK